MPRVTVKKDEPIEKAIRRFKKLCKKEDIIKEMKKRRCYVKPSEKRRKRLNKSRKKK